MQQSNKPLAHRYKTRYEIRRESEKLKACELNKQVWKLEAFGFLIFLIGLAALYLLSFSIGN